jgi:ubiquinol-cytochrome c reductase core subunit 2
LAHSTAFHVGLGYPLYPTTTTPIAGYLNEQAVADFAHAAYNKDNFSIAADGASQKKLQQWIEPFFKKLPSSAPTSSSLESPATKYFGGEQRTAQMGESVMVIAFPGAPLGTVKPEIAVLNALLGGDSAIKWSPGFSLLSKAAAKAPGAHSHARNLPYSDAGLVTIEIRGDAPQVKIAAQESVKAVKSIADGSVSKEDLAKAIARAKFDTLSASELSGVGLVAAGSSVLHGAHPFQVMDAIKAYEGVTVDKVKSVRNLLDPVIPT